MLSWEDIARQAANVLAEGSDPGLPALVEAELHRRATDGQREMYADKKSLAVALAAMLVGAASLGWDIYGDLARDAAAPSKTELALKIKLEIEVPRPARAEDRDRVIAIVVDEICATPPSSEGSE